MQAVPNWLRSALLLSTLAIVVLAAFSASSSADTVTWDCHAHRSSEAMPTSAACGHEGHDSHSPNKVALSGLIFGVVSILIVGGAQPRRPRLAGLRDRLCSSLLFRPPQLAR